MAVDTAGIDLLPEAARRALVLQLLAEAGAVSIRVNDASGEIVHGCLFNPAAHGDQSANPTASINYRTLAGSCFGCRAAGGLLWITKTILGTDEAGARTWLNGNGAPEGGPIALPTFLAALTEPHTARPRRDESIPRYHPSALEGFRRPHRYWTDPPAPPGAAGGGRGVHPATAAARQLGYDRATDRVIIPHIWRGDLVGWQARPAGAIPAGSPKYQNTPGFPRRNTLHHLPPDTEELVLVESVMAELRHAHAMPDIAATFGAQVTDEQIAAIIALPRLRRVICWPDSDTKGWDALDGGRFPAEGLIARLSPYVPVMVVDSPFTGDPADVDTPTAIAMREQWTVPAALWRRPAALACWHCQQAEHEGPCQLLAAAA
jgi:hypothetical protein